MSYQRDGHDNANNLANAASGYGYPPVNYDTAANLNQGSGMGSYMNPMSTPNPPMQPPMSHHMSHMHHASHINHHMNPMSSPAHHYDAAGLGYRELRAPAVSQQHRIPVEPPISHQQSLYHQSLNQQLVNQQSINLYPINQQPVVHQAAHQSLHQQSAIIEEGESEGGEPEEREETQSADTFAGAEQTREPQEHEEQEEQEEQEEVEEEEEEEEEEDASAEEASDDERSESPEAETTEPTSTSQNDKKRKADKSLDDEITEYTQDLNDRVCPDSFENSDLPTCAAIRVRLNKLFDSGIMTKKAFCEQTSLSAQNLNSFMKKSGTYGGSGAAAWHWSWVWFKQRDELGLKMPDVKKRQKIAMEQGGQPGGSSGSRSTSASKVLGLPSAEELAKIKLGGDEEDKVEVYDTCDEIRRKINAHLKTPGLTQAQFLRDLFIQLGSPKVKNIQSNLLNSFRGKKGPRNGSKSTVFYSSYVYFERLRIYQRKPKSKHREEMEALYAGRGGLDIENDHRTMWVGSASSKLVMTQFGQIHSV